MAIDISDKKSRDLIEKARQCQIFKILNLRGPWPQETMFANAQVNFFYNVYKKVVLKKETGCRF